MALPIPLSHPSHLTSIMSIQLLHLLPPSNVHSGLAWVGPGLTKTPGGSFFVNDSSAIADINEREPLSFDSQLTVNSDVVNQSLRPGERAYTQWRAMGSWGLNFAFSTEPVAVFSSTGKGSIIIELSNEADGDPVTASVMFDYETVLPAALRFRSLIQANAYWRVGFVAALPCDRVNISTQLRPAFPPAN